MTLAEFFKAQEPLSAETINLDAVRKSRAALAEALEPMERLRAELLASIPEVDPDLPPTTAEQEERARRMADVRTLTDGKWQRGISDPRLQPFVGGAGPWDTKYHPQVGGPGIAALEHWITRCDEIIERETRLRETQWPAPFRYSGKPGAMHFEGRRLRVGEVVSLTRAQYEAWRDRFSSVDSEVTEAVTT